MDINTSLLWQTLIPHLIHILVNGFLAHKAGKKPLKYVLISVIPLVSWMTTFYLLMVMAVISANNSAPRS